MNRFLFITIAVAVLSTGCLTRSYVPTARYALAPQPTVEPGVSTGQSLAVRLLIAAQPYNQPIVYRTSDFEVGTFPYAEWAEPPREVVTRALMDALTASGRFSDVGYSLDQTRPNLILSGEVRRFDILRDEEPWKALCEVRLELRKAIEKELIWQDTLVATKDLTGNDVADAPAAMSSAISEIVNKAVRDIGASL
ncbi:MAG: hypothetical protein AMXMBFR84_40480 [Candidatus Hydrogenedentota bacterium]